MHSLIALLTCALMGGALGAIIQCPGGYRQGEQPARGRYWYTCTEKGILTPEGCLDPSDKRIRINEAYVENGYEMQCYVDEAGYLRMRQSACVIKGQRILPGGTWDDKKWFLTCSQEGDYIYQRVSGCLKENRRIRVNERATHADVIFECQEKSNGAIALCSVGCSHAGRDYYIGQTFEDNQYYYNCTTVGGYCHKAQIGCTENGARFTDGQTWLSGINVWRCDVTGDKAERVVVGCVGNDGKRYDIGQRWNDGSVEVVCKLNNDRAYKEPQFNRILS